MSPPSFEESPQYLLQSQSQAAFTRQCDDGQQQSERNKYQDNVVQMVTSFRVDVF
jgi:hypothetical protein